MSLFLDCCFFIIIIIIIIIIIAICNKAFVKFLSYCVVHYVVHRQVILNKEWLKIIGS